MASDSDDFLDRRKRAMDAYESAYTEWFAALPVEERRRLAQLGIDKPDVARMVSTEETDDRQEQHQEAELFAWLHPVDEIEREERAGEVNEIAAMFAQAMSWAAKGRTPVEVGQRIAVMMHVLRPALVAGMALEELHPDLIQEACAVVEDRGEEIGTAFGRPLEWLRRASTFAQLGIRATAMLYVLSGAMTQGATLAQIGRGVGSTRQAVDKLVQDFRDTFGGLRSGTMRSEENRERCRVAQLSRDDGDDRA